VRDVLRGLSIWRSSVPVMIASPAGAAGPGPGPGPAWGRTRADVVHPRRARLRRVDLLFEPAAAPTRQPSQHVGASSDAHDGRSPVVRNVMARSPPAKRVEAIYSLVPKLAWRRRHGIDGGISI
jgi:hypothetical protein